MIDHSTCGGGLGSGGLGANPFGSGYELALLSARQYSLNAVDVFFLGVPEASNAFSITDVLNTVNWSLSVVEPFGAQNRLVQDVARIDASTIRVFVDGPLQQGVTYRIACSVSVLSDLGIPLDPACDYVDFDTFGLAFSTQKANGQVIEPRMDLANPYLERDAVQDPSALGTFQLTDRRDLALVTGDSYLRKRILRRATTALGGFFHLSGYGFLEPLKAPITPDLLRRMQTQAQAQVLREPDVTQASVVVQRDPNSPFLVIVTIKATTVGGTVVEADFTLDAAT